MLFVPRPERKVLFQHRPNQLTGVHPQEICKFYGLTYIPVKCDSDIDNTCDFYLVTGAGILSAECLMGKRVLNGHPGIIPAVRGLDAFKWSIYNELPLGVTLHYVDDSIDAGEVVSVIQTPVFPSDGLETLARRHYETEIYLLSNFERYLKHRVNLFHSISANKSMSRMKYEEELKLEHKFAIYKQMYCK